MGLKDDALHELSQAEAHILTAKGLISQIPDPVPTSVPVNPGDNILQKIQDNPEGTIFDVHHEFMQAVGTVIFPKPCTLKSTGGKLLGSITVKPDTAFIGMKLDGLIANTILTAADRLFVHDCTLTGSPVGQHRGIAVNCAGVRIRDSRIVNIWKDQDTQAIGGWDRTKDLVVSNCFLEASGENIMFGGADSSSEENMPNDILIEDCHMTKKIEWRADPKAACKNLLELKAVRNIHIRRNTMEYSFVDAQIGYGIVFAVRNQDGRAPWSTVRNVVFEDNIIRHVAGGISILGRDDIPDRPSLTMDNILIARNKIEAMSSVWGGNGREIFITGGPSNLTFDGNSFECLTTPAGIYFDQPQHLCNNLVFKNQELIIEGHYGIFGSNASGLGKVVLDQYAPGYIWQNNKVRKSGIRTIQWPSGTIFV